MTQNDKKIGLSSRYYEPFRILKARVSAYNVFRLIHNEDKGTNSYPYLYHSYVNELEPISITSKLIHSIKQCLEDNLFNTDEKKLLLTELTPYVKSFGDDVIASLTKRIDVTEEQRLMYLEYIEECKKTINSLSKINELLNVEFIELYTSIVYEKGEAKYHLNQNGMKSKDDIAEIILNEFGRTNSRAGHIVPMRTFRFSIIPKLNPKEQDLFTEVANDLISAGYLIYEKDGLESLRLTQLGFDKIYEDNFSVQSIITKRKLPTADFPDEIYKDLLTTFFNYGKELETKPRIYQGQSEESLRDNFLANLSGRYEKTTATGETFNKAGKTDIILKDDKGNNLFIAECKWWTGPTGFQDTIDQLFDNYITWRDTKVAIMFFVDNKDFTNVLGQIETESEKHKYFVEKKGKANDSNFSFVFRQKDDSSKKVKLEIMFFHFPK